MPDVFSYPVALHGSGGFVDEAILVAVVFVVIWLAIRLTGKPPDEAEARDAAPTSDGAPPASGERV